MDFNDTPEEAAFRAEARAFLDANCPRKTDALGDWRGLHPRPTDALAEAKAFQAKKHAAGMAGITWPRRYGGRGLAPMMQVIYAQEEQAYVVPKRIFDIGLGMCVPTVLAFATEEQKQRFAPKALSGEEIWCQLFSEPSAGSDVAALRTRAEQAPDGSGDWIVNGQKIWTSGAHFSDFGILLTRTDPDVPKHNGLTMFFLDMRAPGVEVRPIRQVSGDSDFNEVFFTDVRIPDSQRLGGVGMGWKVALTTLMNERLAVGDVPPPDFNELFQFVRDLELEDGPALANAAVREKLADFYVQTQGLRLTRFRTMTALSRGQVPGPENSIGKLVNATKMQEIGAFAQDLMDQAGVRVGPDAPMGGLFQRGWLWAAGLRIAGGTDEILRNIIAERVLGLPGDVRVDKDVSFKDLPRGSV